IAHASSLTSSLELVMPGSQNAAQCASVDTTLAPTALQAKAAEFISALTAGGMPAAQATQTGMFQAMVRLTLEKCASHGCSVVTPYEIGLLE
ncbi:unnamed protein product, partial [Amoebophrya sp. A25]